MGGPVEGEAEGARLVEEYPGGALPHFIARAFDNDAAGGEAGLHDAPGVSYFFFGVLAEHIEGADELWAVVGEFEAAFFEADSVLGREDAGGVYFEANDL